MKSYIHQQLIKWLPFSLLGGILAFFYSILLIKEAPIYGLNLVTVFLYLWFLFSFLGYFVWTRFLFPQLQLYSKRWIAFWLITFLFAGFWLTDNIPVLYPIVLNASLASSLFLKGAFFISVAVGIGLSLFAVSVIFVARFTAPVVSQSSRYRWLLFALPMIFIWLIYLLAFWPGMMSADSLDQWRQVLSGQYYDHHPAFHTFTIWLLTRIALTPAVVALAQVIALGLVAGLILAYFETLGIPTPLVWIASFLFGISPVNGSMVITLWKDVPYSTALLAFTFLIFKSVQTKGKFFSHWYAWILLGITAALTALFRHNGLPVILATFSILLLVFFRQWRPLAFAFSLFLGLYFGITGPGYQLAHVQKSNTLLEDSTSLYTIVERAVPGSQVDAVLETMHPFVNDWQCSVFTSLTEANRHDPLNQDEAFVQKAINLVKFSPSLLAYDYRCNRSLIWIIWDPAGEVRNPSHAEYWIDSNPYGITPNSKIPILQTIIQDFVVKTSRDTNINWLVWRPALFLYIFLLVAVIYSLKQKNIKSVVFTVPILLQAISSTMIVIAPNFRYHYATYLVALLFWPLLFASPNKSSAKHQAGNAAEAGSALSNVITMQR